MLARGEIGQQDIVGVVLVPRGSHQWADGAGVTQLRLGLGTTRQGINLSCIALEQILQALGHVPAIKCTLVAIT